MKKKLLLGSVLAAAVVTLAACGNNPEPTKAPTTAPTTEPTTAPTTAPTTVPTEAPTTAPTTVAPQVIGVMIAKTSTHKETFVIGEEFSYEGLKVNAIYDNDDILPVTDFVVTVKNAEGVALEGNTFTAAGEYTVTVAVGEATKTYTVTVQKAQYVFQKIYPTDAMGEDLVNTTYTADPVTVIQNEEVTITIEGTSSKLQVTDSSNNSVAHAHNGVIYNTRLQVNTSGKSALKVTAVRSGKLTLLGSGQVEGQNRAFVLADPEGTTYQSVLQMTTEESLSVNTFDIEAGVTYTICSSYNGINIYGFVFDFSVDADTVVENVDMAIEGYDVEFTTTGESQLNCAAPAGLVVKAFNNYGVPTVVDAANYTVTVTAKDSTEALTAITTPGTYTVTVALNGTELTASYDVTVTNPNATVTDVVVTTSDATDKLFYGSEALAAEGLTVVATDSDNLSKTLAAGEYTVELFLNGAKVDAFSVSTSDANEYTVVVTYGGVSDSYVVSYYAEKETVINVEDMATKVATGATLYTNKAFVNTVYEDNSSVKLATVVTMTLYSDAELTTEITDVAAAFAQDGTAYAKFVAEGCETVVLTLTIATVSTEEFIVDASAGAFDKNNVIYEGTAFTITNGAGGKTEAVACANPAAANDDSGLVFSAALLPTGGSRTAIVTANQDITITIYFTSSDSKFNTNGSGYGKGGELTVNGTQVETVPGNKINDIAYAYTMTLAAGESAEFGVSSNRFVLFGLVAQL